MVTPRSPCPAQPLAPRSAILWASTPISSSTSITATTCGTSSTSSSATRTSATGTAWKRHSKPTTSCASFRVLQGEPIMPSTQESPTKSAGAAAGDRKVDHSALRTNQAFIITLLVLAFVLNAWWLVAFVSAVMLIGTAFPQAGLFKAVYFKVLKPAGIAKPDVKIDNPEPHLFAQGLGGVFTLLSTVALLVGGGATVGWALSWLVVALAALNLFAGICVGCIVYYQLNRLGLRGFDRSPIRS